MRDREVAACDWLFEYMSGEGSDMQRKRFEKHLSACPKCLEESSLWREVWDRLGEDVELLEPPADLKESVMKPLIGNEITNPAKSNPAISFRPSGKRSAFSLRRVIAGMIGIAVLLMAFLSGWLFRDAQTEQTGKGQPFAAVSPANIEAVYKLNANRADGKFEDHPRAYGVACLVRTDGKEQLVVYVFGTPETKDTEAYQVWLLKDGKRTSAGTFTVGESGIGITTLPMDDQAVSFDTVGITLEPDSHSSAPRGPKMFGSDKQI
ncbi:anti-sigma factor domain-containing protein [Cohnella soli]|uniref:Anti-sigma-W factor RsiW n=1 Tax=Cohnella soli TaxID=425005 RepID=A0ABW0HTQ5_9BACL